MDWSTPFIIYRIDASGSLKEVYHAKDLNAARYWLKYIAKPGDVCCRTPTHPKHSTHNGAPEYFSHKETSGCASSVKENWQNYAKGKSFDGQFPNEEKGVQADEAESTTV
ncbi:MAG: hypothetical protein GX589_08990 [Deltaproteobacteria bacterium]|nr:hypothetical protein [Deltaproteobacteria bacterium]